MSERAFSRPALVAILAVGGLSLAAAFASAIFGAEHDEVRSAGADAFSRSAIGHRAFVELLERSGHEVVVARRGERALGEGEVLLCLEPIEAGALVEPSVERLERLLAGAPRALVALPKREGELDPKHREWLRSARLVDEDVVSAVLEAVGVEGKLERSGASASDWSAPELGPGFEPELDAPQLLQTSDLDPIASKGELVLAGFASAADGMRRVVLTDPDLLSNHGLGDGGNAALALALVERAGGPGARVVIDETLHGHGLEPSVWAELGRFPLVLALAQTLLAALFLAWSGARRFGAPVRERRTLAAGKRLLIENTTELLLEGGRATALLARYVETSLRRASDASHLPPELDEATRRARLESIHARTGGATSLAAVHEALAKVDARHPRATELVEAARAARRFREEVSGGGR